MRNQREFEEYHLDVQSYNLDTDEIIDVKAKIAEQIDSNLSVMERGRAAYPSVWKRRKPYLHQMSVT